ncbi:hypothetical protein BSKO_03712 [Bryopsis sp. KO-2023]|nr:hypothetical protein BSKO_03712 [Bryopsis sp. KO-2023]
MVSTITLKAGVSVLLLSLLIPSSSGNFHPSDFIQTSRRAQFHGKRTHWHDLLGRHCPRFGVNTVIAVPLPKPKGFDDVDDYKVQLSFDHERLLTSWVTVIAKHPRLAVGWEAVNAKGMDSVFVPFVNLEMVSRGDRLVKVRANSFRLPKDYLGAHERLVEEYANATHWPKHVMIKYTWENLDQVDADRGLMVLLYGGLMALTVAMFGVVVSYKDKFTEFIREVAIEQDVGNMGGPSGEKAD